MNTTCIGPIRVLLVAPQMMCWGLQRLVETGLPHLEVVGSAFTLAESAPMLLQEVADVVVVDLDGMDGDDIPRAGEWPHERVVVVTASRDLAMLDRAVVAGVRGIVRKDEPAPVLLRAIERVHAGELWIDRSATSRIFMEMARQKAREANDPDRMKIATLTSRERQMIRAVATDAAAPGKVIASRLCISEHTLRNHLTSIYAKLGLCNRLDLYAYATRHSLNKLD